MRRASAGNALKSARDEPSHWIGFIQIYEYQYIARTVAEQDTGRQILPR